MSVILWPQIPCVVCTACFTEAVCRAQLTNCPPPSLSSSPLTCPRILFVLTASSRLNSLIFCQPFKPCTELCHSKCFFFLSFLYMSHGGSDLLLRRASLVFCLSVNHMFGSLKVIYYTVCVIECVLVKKKKKDKCHLICKDNNLSIMTWTTPLMRVNDQVVM